MHPYICISRHGMNKRSECSHKLLSLTLSESYEWDDIVGGWQVRTTYAFVIPISLLLLAQKTHRKTINIIVMR